MLTRLDLRGFDGDLASVVTRPDAGENADGAGRLAAVRAIIRDVRERGDAAVIELTERFDGARLDSLRVPAAHLGNALQSVPPAFREALEFAQAQITEYHRTQLPAERRHEREGVVIRDLVRPVDRAGLYVPGGRASYPSTV